MQHQRDIMGPLRTDKKPPLIKACSRGANILRHVCGAGVWALPGKEGCRGMCECRRTPPDPRTAPSTAASWADGLCSVCPSPKHLYTCFAIELMEMCFSRLLLSLESRNGGSSLKCSLRLCFKLICGSYSVRSDVRDGMHI